MFATLSVSFVTVAITIYKTLFFLGKGKTNKHLLPQVLSYLEANDVTKALRAVGADDSPMGRVLKAALQRANRSEREIRRAVETVALEEIPRVKGGTVYLPQLSNLATLFGLIGTIHGLILSFSGAGGESAAARQAALSLGISIAFYNTFFGLSVATLSVVFYLGLLTVTNKSMALMEKAAATVVDSILWFREGGRRSA